MKERQMKTHIVSSTVVLALFLLAVYLVEAQGAGGGQCLKTGPDACYQAQCINGVSHVTSVKDNGAGCTESGWPGGLAGTCQITGHPNEPGFSADCLPAPAPMCNAGCVPAGAMTGNQILIVQKGVLSLAETAAEEVTREGPTAWNKIFEKTPQFFMAADGRITYADGASAQDGNVGLARTVKQITLRWGKDIRVDPLTPEFATMAASYHEVRVDTEGRRVEEDGFFTGTAEYSHSKWQFRNAHWSTVASH
jgi:hypothetical protein